MVTVQRGCDRFSVEVIHTLYVLCHMVSHQAVDPQLRLLDAPMKRPGLRWVLPIDVRLDELVDLANLAGANSNRQEVLSALVLAATAEPDALLQAVIDLRRSTVRQALVSESAHRLPIHGRGRRVRLERSQENGK